VEPPRWLADEMLGRLARYLRFVGCDTAYGRGMSDDELLLAAGNEDRVLLTRDRLLSQRAPRSLLLESAVLADQWRAVRAAWPSVPSVPTFARCTLCNGELAPLATEDPRATALPPQVRLRGATAYACGRCGHLYWEGSHTASVRERIAAWERSERPA
jgi:uncharacterized protein